MKRSYLLLSLLSLTLLVGCNKSGKSSEEPLPFEGEVTITFYADYNQKIVKNVYYECTVQNGELITDKPNKPSEAPFPEFPNFKGWSSKEIIDDDKDLWDFSTDKVISKTASFELFGIWVAEGE